MQELLKKPKGKLFAVDMDGTLCRSGFPKREPSPKKEIIKIVQSIHDRGGHVFIYTARQEKYYPETKAWLVKHRVPFVGIAMRHKPQADCYLDDKVIHINHLIWWGR